MAIMPGRPNGYWEGTPGVAGTAVPIPTEPYITTVVEMLGTGGYFYICVRDSTPVVGLEWNQPDHVGVIVPMNTNAESSGFMLQGNPQIEKYLWIWGPADAGTTINFYG